MAKAELFYVRHQAWGLVIEHPFVGAAPTQAEVDAILAECEKRHGKKSKKTDKPFWAKVVRLFDGVETTVACAHCGPAPEKVADVNARASGGCPIREAGFERWPDSDLELVIAVGKMTEEEWGKAVKTDKRVAHLRPTWRAEDQITSELEAAMRAESQINAAKPVPRATATGTVRNPGE